MITKTIVTGIIAVLFLVFAIVFLMGKGDKLIAGYNTASEEERAKVNIKRLRILMAIISVITAGYVSILPIIGDNPQDQMVGMFVFFAITILFVILANTEHSESSESQVLKRLRFFPIFSPRTSQTHNPTRSTMDISRMAQRSSTKYW